MNLQLCIIVYSINCSEDNTSLLFLFLFPSKRSGKYKPTSESATTRNKNYLFWSQGYLVFKNLLKKLRHAAALCNTVQHILQFFLIYNMVLLIVSASGTAYISASTVSHYMYLQWRDEITLKAERKTNNHLFISVLAKCRCNYYDFLKLFDDKLSKTSLYQCIGTVSDSVPVH